MQDLFNVFPFKMTLAEIDKIRVSKEFAELRRKVQEIDEAREAGHAV